MCVCKLHKVMVYYFSKLKEKNKRVKLYAAVFTSTYTVRLYTHYNSMTTFYKTFRREFPSDTRKKREEEERKRKEEQVMMAFF